jgi:RNA-directed DNA polymerase
MGGKRQNNQLELAFEAESRSETPRAAIEGTEPPTANRDTESPAETDTLMEEVLDKENLKEALRRVKANKGSPGLDGMTVQNLTPYLVKHWPEHREQLLNGTYQPQPVRRKEILKLDGGGVRKLGIPTVLDRMIQQALMQVLQRKWNPTFSQYSYGFRPHRSTFQAVTQAQEYIAEGYRIVVDFDLEKFFDRVNHDKLMAQVAKRITDKRVLKLIRAFLNAGVMEGGLVSPSVEGTPQGGPLSPLLSNLVLDELDQELEQRGHRFVRYADDCNIYVRSLRAGERVMESVKRFISERLKLKVNDEKSAVAKPQERKFLGFSFTGQAEPKRRIAPQAVKRFKNRVREITRRRAGTGTGKRIEELKRYLIGWRGYYSFCQTPSVLVELDSWVRRRLRCIFWIQWKTGRRRFDELHRRGIERQLAANTAGSNHGPWRMGLSVALSSALSNAFFDSIGLPRLAAGR